SSPAAACRSRWRSESAAADSARTCSDGCWLYWLAVLPSRFSPLGSAARYRRRGPVTTMPQRVTPRHCPMPDYSVRVSVTRGNRACRDALAHHILANPASIDNDVQIVLGDGHRRDEEGVHFNALGAA